MLMPRPVANQYIKTAMAKSRQLKTKSAAMAPIWSRIKTVVVSQFKFWRLGREIGSGLTHSPSWMNWYHISTDWGAFVRIRAQRGARAGATAKLLRPVDLGGGTRLAAKDNESQACCHGKRPQIRFRKIHDRDIELG